MEKLKTWFDQASNKDNVDVVFPFDIVDIVLTIWNDSNIQRCFSQANVISLETSVEKYMISIKNSFMNDIDRIVASGYVPTDEDILLVRKSTKEIGEYDFQVRHMTLRFVDVGGQVHLRSFWA